MKSGISIAIAPLITSSHARAARHGAGGYLKADKLKACYHEVHNGRHNKRREYENGVCAIWWEYTVTGLPTNLHVESCWSGGEYDPLGRYGLEQWYCRRLYPHWRWLYKPNGAP
jgi:hypothetical protein